MSLWLSLKTALRLQGVSAIANTRLGQADLSHSVTDEWSRRQGLSE
jgi:hypothetical protein